MALTPQAQETFTRLFGAPAAPHPTDPELYEILQNQIFDEVFSTGVLTDVEREIITVTALGCLQTLPQLRAHAAAALNVGATPLQLREALYQCAPYIGYPRTLNAVATLDEVLTQRGVELPLPTAATVAPDDAQARHRAGAAIQEPLYGDEIEEGLATLPPPGPRANCWGATRPSTPSSPSSSPPPASATTTAAACSALPSARSSALWRSPRSAPPRSSAPISPAPCAPGTASSASPPPSSRPCPTSAGPRSCRPSSSSPATTRPPPTRPTADGGPGGAPLG